MKIDFSEAHFLDHSVLDPYCATLPGGRRKHLDYWWQFKGEPALTAKLRFPLCLIGRHRERRWWRRRDGETGEQMHARTMSRTDWDGVLCPDCGKKL